MKIIWEGRKHLGLIPVPGVKYKLSETRLFIESGLISTSYKETQLYRIVDVKLKRTLWNKIFNKGTIVLVTRDMDQPVIELQNIDKSYDVKEMLVHLIEDARRKNFVRDINVGDGFDLTDADGDGIPDIFQ